MVKTEKLFEPITESDLKHLQRFALKEHGMFFERNPHLKAAYANSLIGIALCQGAALHYVNPKVGIKDFDIWYFYRKNEEVGFPYRAKRSIENGYKGRRLDFLRRAIEKVVFDLYPNDPGKCIMEYLFERNTKTKRLLLEKAIVGLFPDEIFGKVIWKGEEK